MQARNFIMLRVCVDFVTHVWRRLYKPRWLGMCAANRWRNMFHWWISIYMIWHKPPLPLPLLPPISELITATHAPNWYYNRSNNIEWCCSKNVHPASQIFKVGLSLQNQHHCIQHPLLSNEWNFILLSPSSPKLPFLAMLFISSNVGMTVEKMSQLIG